ncbi:MAG: hypothetical protein Q9205_004388, partial [Flavoplaca limonia]
ERDLGTLQNVIGTEKHTSRWQVEYRDSVGSDKPFDKRISLPSYQANLHPQHLQKLTSRSLACLDDPFQMICFFRTSKN